MTGHADDVAEQKARLREQFPGWNFIIARPSGRWWALKPGGDAATPAAVIADSPTALTVELRKLPGP